MALSVDAENVELVKLGDAGWHRARDFDWARFPGETGHRGTSSPNY